MAHVYTVRTIDRLLRFNTTDDDILVTLLPFAQTPNAPYELHKVTTGDGHTVTIRTDPTTTDFLTPSGATSIILDDTNSWVTIKVPQNGQSPAFVASGGTGGTGPIDAYTKAESRTYFVSQIPISQLQAAINAGAGMIVLNAGTGALTAPLTFPSTANNIVIQGKGSSTVIQRGAAMPAGVGFFDFAAGANNITIRDLVIDGMVLTPVGVDYASITAGPLQANLTLNTTVWVHGGARFISFENVTIQHTGGYAALLDATSGGDVTDIEFQGCLFTNNRPHVFGTQGDLAYGSWTGGIFYASISANPGDGVVKRLTVDSCQFLRNTGNQVWGWSQGPPGLAAPPVNFGTHHEQIVKINNKCEDIGLDGLQFGNVGSGACKHNQGRRIGYITYTDTDTPQPRYLRNYWAVFLDTSGYCSGVDYSDNSCVSPNGGFIDLDGFRNGSIANNTGRVPLPTDAEYAVDQVALFGPRWWSGANYQKGERVIYSGTTWIAQVATSGTQPGTNPSVWAAPTNGASAQITDGINMGNTEQNGGAWNVSITGNVLMNMGSGSIVMSYAKNSQCRGNMITHPATATEVPIEIFGPGGGSGDEFSAYNNVVSGNTIAYDGGNVCVLETGPACSVNNIFGNQISGSNTGELALAAGSGSMAALRFSSASNPPVGSAVSESIWQREGTGATAALKHYVNNKAGLQGQTMALEDTGPVMNLSKAGAALTGAYSTGNRATLGFYDAVSTGKVTSDSFIALMGYDDPDSTFGTGADANLLDANWLLLRGNKTAHTIEASLTTSGGTRVWTTLGGGSGDGISHGAVNLVQLSDGSGGFISSPSLLFDTTNQSLDILGMAGQAALTVGNSVAQSPGIGPYIQAFGFVSAADSWSAIQGLGGSVATGAFLQGYAVAPATGGTGRGGYIDFAPLSYGNHPTPLTGLSAFGSTDVLLWASGQNDSPVINTSIGLQTNAFINAAGGFNCTQTYNFDSIQTVGGMHVKHTTYGITNDGPLYSLSAVQPPTASSTLYGGLLHNKGPVWNYFDPDLGIWSTVNFQGSGGVTSIVQGTGILMAPASGTGIVTIAIGQPVSHTDSVIFANITANGNVDATGYANFTQYLLNGNTTPPLVTTGGAINCNGLTSNGNVSATSFSIASTQVISNALDATLHSLNVNNVASIGSDGTINGTSLQIGSILSIGSDRIGHFPGIVFGASGVVGGSGPVTTTGAVSCGSLSVSGSLAAVLFNSTAPATATDVAFQAGNGSFRVYGNGTVTSNGLTVNGFVSASSGLQIAGTTVISNALDAIFHSLNVNNVASIGSDGTINGTSLQIGSILSIGSDRIGHFPGIVFGASGVVGGSGPVTTTGAVSCGSLSVSGSFAANSFAINSTTVISNAMDATFHSLNVNNIASIGSDGTINGTSLQIGSILSIGSDRIGHFPGIVFGASGVVGGSGPVTTTGTVTAALFNCTGTAYNAIAVASGGGMSFGAAIGEKIALYDAGSGSRYGLGIQSSLLQIYAASGGSVGIGTGGGSSSFLSILRVDATRCIGINSTAPANTLAIIPVNQLTDLTATYQVAIGEPSNNAGYQMRLGFGPFYSTYWSGVIQTIAGGAYTSCYLQINPNGGLVGIGLGTAPGAYPRYALDVGGDVNVSGVFRINGAAISGGGVQPNTNVTFLSVTCTQGGIALNVTGSGSANSINTIGGITAQQGVYVGPNGSVAVIANNGNFTGPSIQTGTIDCNGYISSGGLLTAHNGLTVNGLLSGAEISGNNFTINRTQVISSALDATLHSLNVNNNSASIGSDGTISTGGVITTSNQFQISGAVVIGNDRIGHFAGIVFGASGVVGGSGPISTSGNITTSGTYHINYQGTDYPGVSWDIYTNGSGFSLFPTGPWNTHLLFRGGLLINVSN